MAKKKAEESVHDIKGRLKSCLKLVNNLENKRDRELILKFRDKCYAKGLGDSRVLFYVIRLKKISELTRKDLDKLDRGDIEKLVSWIERKKYSEWTKQGYKTTLRNFYKLLNDGETPDTVNWIRATPKESKLKKPIILSKKEVLELFRCAEGLREKALVSFMYESGCRSPDELLNMKVNDVEFDEYGAMVRLVSGKTGERRILVVACVPRLRAWIESHPNPKPSSWLWVTERGQYKGRRLKYDTLKSLVNKWVRKAGIEKYVTSYTFRRTRYTHLSNKWPTPVLYRYMGQVMGSKAIKRYVNLSTEAIEETVLGFYGIKNNKKKEEIKPLYCSRCEKQNPPELEFCQYCNSPLTEKAIIKVEEKKRLEIADYIKNVFLEQFKEDPEFRRKVIEERVKELQMQKSG